MAEVTALTPSPPAMMDQPAAPSSPPPPPPLPPSSSAPSLPAESPKPVVAPKSSLYGDRAVMAATALTQPALKENFMPLSHSREVTSSLPEHPPTSPPPSVPAASDSACPPPDQGKEDVPTEPGPSTQQNISPETPGGAADPEAPPCPAQNPTTQQLNLTSNSTSSPPQSPPCIAPFVSDPPSLVVPDSPVLFVVPPPVHSGPALDTLSYLESASMMSGTLESLSGIGDDGSSLGSDSELNGPVMKRTDKYGFLGGAQYSDGKWVEPKY